MRTSIIILVSLSSLLAFGCTDGQPRDPGVLSKADHAPSGESDEAANRRICELYGRASDCDACLVAGWYSDGECDTFCAVPDLDCDLDGGHEVWPSDDGGYETWPSDDGGYETWPPRDGGGDGSTWTDGGADTYPGSDGGFVDGGTDAATDGGTDAATDGGNDAATDGGTDARFGADT